MSLQEKYQTLLELANTNGTTYELSEGDGVLHVTGTAPDEDAKNALWAEYERIDPEFRGEREFGMLRRHAQPHEQVQIGCPICRLDDLGQFLMRVEAEGSHAVDLVGLGDGAPRLDRMHEAQRGIGKQRKLHRGSRQSNRLRIEVLLSLK